jgi:hypothetical protein
MPVIFYVIILLINMKKYPALGVLVLTLLICACASAPRIEKSQYNQRHYIFTILLDPDRPSDSPRLDISLSLLYMEYPAEQAKYLSELLYSTNSLDEYKDRIIEEQRKLYRRSIVDKTTIPSRKDSASYNWRYAESIAIRSSGRQGIVIERDYDIYSGGAHGLSTKRYYVLDMNERRQLRINDLFANYQGEKRLRDIIYFELGKYSRLESGQKLSQGIFFSDEPELSFNFFVTNEGLGLYWEAYQIAPHAHGNIEIIVPWQVIRPLMLTEGVELLTKFSIFLFV